jgi:hypothetical protein
VDNGNNLPSILIHSFLTIMDHYKDVDPLKLLPFQKNLRLPKNQLSLNPENLLVQLVPNQEYQENQENQENQESQESQESQENQESQE